MKRNDHLEVLVLKLSTAQRETVWEVYQNHNGFDTAKKLIETYKQQNERNNREHNQKCSTSN